MAKISIAIIGATGKTGTAIAKTLAKGSYRLLLFAHDKAKLQNVKEEIYTTTPAADLDCVGCPMDASWEADVILLAVPYSAEKEVAEKIKAFATQKVVVSISNPPHAAPSGFNAAEELQQLLPSSKIVKASSTVGAAHFLEAIKDEQGADIRLAGNDAEAISLVKKIIETAGLNPVIAGDSTMSRTRVAEKLHVNQQAT